MIAGIFHDGSGLGDQLFRYITVRTFAEKKGFDFGMMWWKNFKGDTIFSNIKDIKMSHLVESSLGYWGPDKFGTGFMEKDVRDAQGNDIRSYDPEINFVEDNTIIDGSFEDDKYWRHNLKNINEWLKVEPFSVPNDTCLIGFRGGEYASIPELFLGSDYYQPALKEINKRNNLSRYEVHTDDPVLARKSFPEYMDIVENTAISHSRHSNMKFNWCSMRYAKYAIIPNSAFFILPRILKHFEDPTAVTIAPRYWARRNTKGPWRPAAYYPEFSYL